jgi:hypothetical protein
MEFAETFQVIYPNELQLGQRAILVCASRAGLGEAPLGGPPPNIGSLRALQFPPYSIDIQ